MSTDQPAAPDPATTATPKARTPKPPRDRARPPAKKTAARKTPESRAKKPPAKKATAKKPPAPEASPTLSAKMHAALADLYGGIQKRHPDRTENGKTVPGLPAQIIITVGDGGNKFGGLTTIGLWKDPETGGVVAQVMLAAQTVAHGPRAILEIFLHESAHLLATTRGIKDCSASGNQYHNEKFKALSVEMGLTPPAQKHKTRGWTAARLGDETAEEYREELKALEAAALSDLAGTGHAAPEDDDPADEAEGGGGDAGDETAPTAKKRFKVTCECGDPEDPDGYHDMTPRMYTRAAQFCAECGQRFRNDEFDDAIRGAVQAAAATARELREKAAAAAEALESYEQARDQAAKLREEARAIRAQADAARAKATAKETPADEADAANKQARELSTQARELSEQARAQDEAAKATGERRTFKDQARMTATAAARAEIEAAELDRIVDKVLDHPGVTLPR